MPPVVQIRSGPSIALAHSATFTASPSFAGATALTRHPTPIRAAACRAQIRPPAAASAARHAAADARNANPNAPAPTASQPGSAPASDDNASATLGPRSPGAAATATSAASAATERAIRGVEILIVVSIDVGMVPEVCEGTV